jgi:hypothetical protein
MQNRPDALDDAVVVRFREDAERLSIIAQHFLQLHLALVIILFVSDYRCEHHNRREFLRLSAAEQKCVWVAD